MTKYSIYSASKGGTGGHKSLNSISDATEHYIEKRSTAGKAGFVIIETAEEKPITPDYYIAKKDNDYYLPVFGSKQVESSDYTVLNTEEYKTPGNYTWTCPQGVTKIRIILSGGGGGGGGGFDFYNQSDGRSGGNGGKGQLIERIITVVPNTPYSVTVGAGGTAGVTTHASSGVGGFGTDGGNGGKSSFGSYTANGGNGGDGAGYEGDNSGDN